MLKSLDIKNFTVFSKAKFNFAKGINVIIGENGVGKSHLLKLAYLTSFISHSIQQRSIVKQELQREIAQKFTGVFRPDFLGRLTSRKQCRNRCEISIKFFDRNNDYRFSFASNSREEVTVDSVMTDGVKSPVIFFPTMESISIYPGFASLYRDKHLSFDETYYDLCLALERNLNRGPRYESIKPFLEPIEEVLGGNVRNENGRFYLKLPGQGNMEIPLVAEGHRKLATIAFLIANGSLLDNGIFFWDEPETNLNPALMCDLVNVFLQLTRMGIQVFLTSHSLIFIKEIDLQLQQTENKISSKWFALEKQKGEIIISEGEQLAEIDPIKALDVEIEQSDRFFQFENSRSW